jgi:hypothetical protein
VSGSGWGIGMYCSGRAGVKGHTLILALEGQVLEVLLAKWVGDLWCVCHLSQCSSQTPCGPGHKLYGSYKEVHLKLLLRTSLTQAQAA